MSAKVIIGMSGGVDSAVSAHLLLQQGYAVEGLFMKNWEEDDGTEYCTALEDLADAQAVCDKLGIELRTANFAAEYWDNVFEDFLADYRAGHTPNPDVLCNREIKFKHFSAYASTLGADYIATGHYVQWLSEGEGPARLSKGTDAGKDQSYFLQAVPRAAFDNALFPIGHLMKSSVREIAQQAGLHNHQRKDSTGICFIGERRFQDFLARYIERSQGPITDPEGRVVGEHGGLHNFTLGQRQGLKIGGLKNRPEAPWYVVAKDPRRNRLVVAQDPGLLDGQWLRASEPNWLVPVQLPLHCHAKIRHRQADQACTISPAADGSLLVRFEQPQRAIACGQFIAFYAGATLLGGAKIKATANTVLQLN